MRLFRAAQMREADARAAALGIATAELMRRAGEAVARATLRRYPGTRLAVVLCGRGNNGGDGYVAASWLARHGLAVRLYELAGAGGEPGDAQDARRAYLSAGGVAEPLDERSAPEVLALLAEAGRDAPPVVIDALFGSGLNRPLAGWLAELVEGLGRGAPGEGRARVVSIDLPSGIAADLAQPIGPHARADLTVELAGHKPAALFYPARHAYGEVVLADIGIPEEVLASCSDVRLLRTEDVRAALPKGDPAGHKYDAGTVSVVAGSGRYLGAAELACRGAWRGGAGLVTLASAAQHPAAWPETIHERLDWRADAGGARAWPPAGLEPKRAAALVVGPGLAPAALEHLGEVLLWAPGPVVLDAAALEPTALGQALGEARRAAERGAGGRGPHVLTPHLGEARRLLEALDDAPAPELLERDPLAAAAQLAEAYGAVVVLKGPTTVIAAPGGSVAASTRGSPALASGGTGDVLAGLLGALLAKPARPAGPGRRPGYDADRDADHGANPGAGLGVEAAFRRVCAGVWLHGVAGELAAAELGASLVAGEVAERLPGAFAAARAGGAAEAPRW